MTADYVPMSTGFLCIFALPMAILAITLLYKAAKKLRLIKVEKK
jgi:hypothetical protein